MFRQLLRILVVIIFVAIPVVLFSKFFLIQNVKCYFLDKPCPSSLQEKLSSQVIGQVLLNYDLEVICTQTRNEFRQLESCSWQKKLPSEVEFRFTLSPISYLLSSSDNSISNVIDLHGVVITQTLSAAEFEPESALELKTGLGSKLESDSNLLLQDSHLVTFTVSDNFKAILEDKIIPSALHQKLLKYLLHSRNLNSKIISSSLLSEDDLSLTLDTGHQVLLDLSQPEQQLAKLELVLEKITPLEASCPTCQSDKDAASFAEYNLIDLRFKYPVLSHSPPPR